MADELDAGNVLQSDPTDIVIEATEPVVEATEPENVDPVLETPPEPPKEHGNKGKTPWYMERINEETNKRRAIEDQLAQKAREAEEARALLERLQGGDKSVTAPARQNNDFDAAVRAEAEKLRTDDQIKTVARAGLSSYADWMVKADVLHKANAASPEFVLDVLAVDPANAHKILYALANDPDRAFHLSSLDSRSRIAELTRISMSETKTAAPAAPKPAAVSKVPAPRPVLEATRSPDETPEDEMTDAQWSAWRKKQMQKAS